MIFDSLTIARDFELKTFIGQNSHNPSDLYVWGVAG